MPGQSQFSDQEQNQIVMGYARRVNAGEAKLSVPTYLWEITRGTGMLDGRSISQNTFGNWRKNERLFTPGDLMELQQSNSVRTGTGFHQASMRPGGGAQQQTPSQPRSAQPNLGSGQSGNAGGFNYPASPGAFTAYSTEPISQHPTVNSPQQGYGQPQGHGSIAQQAGAAIPYGDFNGQVFPLHQGRQYPNINRGSSNNQGGENSNNRTM